MSYDDVNGYVYIRKMGEVAGGDAYSIQDLGYRAYTYLQDTTAEEREAGRKQSTSLPKWTMGNRDNGSW